MRRVTAGAPQVAAPEAPQRSHSCAGFGKTLESAAISTSEALVRVNLDAVSSEHVYVPGDVYVASVRNSDPLRGQRSCCSPLLPRSRQLS
jgi:hypothetical protein